MSNKRDKTFIFRLSEEEKETFSKAANKVGLSLAAWIRTICLASVAVGKVEK